MIWRKKLPILKYHGIIVAKVSHQSNKQQSLKCEVRIKESHTMKGKPELKKVNHKNKGSLFTYFL